MMFSIDPSSGVPVYLQIIEQVKRAMAIGILTSGEQLPTAKQLAQELSVNPNTVLRAYRRLEDEQIIAISQGRGTFVRENDGGDTSHATARRVAEETLERTMRDLTTLVLPKDELRSLVRDATERWLSEKRDA